MLALVACALPARAFEIPLLVSPVMDRAGLLDAVQQQSLEAELLAFARETGHTIVVHTTPSLEGLGIQEYAHGVAERWRTTPGGLDAGAILTVGPGARKVHIEVAPGFASALPAGTAQRILQEQILDELRRDDVQSGIRACVDAMLAAARPVVQPAPVSAAAPLLPVSPESAVRAARVERGASVAALVGLTGALLAGLGLGWFALRVARQRVAAWGGHGGGVRD